MTFSFNINRKGDIPSLILSVVIIFIIGILLLFFARLRDPLYDSLETYFEENENYNDTQVTESIGEIIEVETSAWDYGFLAMMFGVVGGMVMTAFATRVNVAFFWIYIIVSIVVIVLGVVLSNAWQTIATDPNMAETITSYPITNAVLGSDYSVFIAGFMFIFIIVLFGKTPGGEGGFN